MLVRGIVWVFGTLLLAMVPLAIVALIKWRPENGTFLEAMTNEELLAVAFTLGGGAAIDVLVKSAGAARSAKVLAGCSGLVFTVITIVLYVLFKTGAVQLTEAAKISTDQALFLGTGFNALFCEILSEAE